MRATEAIEGQSVVDAEPAAAATADVSSSISVVDVEVVSAIRCDHLLGRLDAASAAQAVGTCGTGRRAVPPPAAADPGLGAASNGLSLDAFYVALAEALDATLVTADGRLAAVSGSRCAIDVVSLR